MPKILVVDDEPMALKLVQTILEKRGFDVVVAASGKDALKAIKSQGGSIGLLITDIVMPEMDGISLAVKAVEYDPELPVLFMSGFVTEDEVDQAASINSYAFIRKPFRPATLVQAVRKMLTTEETA